MAKDLWEKIIDNLAEIIRLRKIGHESIAAKLGKDRSVVTKKLNAKIPFTVEEFFKIIDFLELDPLSLLQAQNEMDLKIMAEKGQLDVSDPGQEITTFLEALKDRYLEHLPSDKQPVFRFLLEQLRDLVDKK